jgi:hypothetical protein
MRLRPYVLRVVPAAVFLLGIGSATARAGPITFLGDPIVTALDVTGGAFLPTSPPTPAGNPPLAADPEMVELPNFGFFEGFRVNGTLDFVAIGGAATVTYVALRPFEIAVNEVDDLAIFYDVGIWSNLEETTATRTRYNAETFVPGIGLTGTGATVPAAIPFNVLTDHPIRPPFGTFLNDTGVNFEFDLPAAAGAYMLIQRVQIEFAGLDADEVIRIDALPVESSIREGQPAVIPEPSTLLLLGLGLLGLGKSIRQRSG